MPESSTLRSKTPPAGSFRRFARHHLQVGTRRPSVLLELWRGGASRKRPPLPAAPALMARAVETALSGERFALSGTFCFIFVDKGFLKELNRQFRNVRRETDVISFSYMNFKEGKPLKSNGVPERGRKALSGDQSLADIYISEDNAAENAERFGESRKNEFLRLVIHGTLHALGYTDYEPRAKKSMWDRQEKALLKTLS